MDTGVYTITHLASGRLYIGSASNFARRWRVHKCLLNKGQHHSAPLQAAWNKYGESAFAFKPLMVCAPENIIFYEQRAIDVYKATDRLLGFNVMPVAGSRAGSVHSESTKLKIKTKRATQVFSAETRAFFSTIRKGRKMPAGFAVAARQWKLGTKHTPEARAKISAAGTGRPCSQATREKRQGKLTVADTQRIIRLHATGEYTQAALAKMFGVDPSMVSRILSRQRWATK